jgi:hypothetical protein
MSRFMKKSNPALPFIVIALSIAIISLLVYFLTKKTNGNDEKKERLMRKITVTCSPPGSSQLRK